MSKVERVKLGDVAILERKTADLEGCVGQPYVSLEDIDSDTGEISIVERSTPRSTKFSFSEKHVLYGKLRPYLRKVSRPCFRGICSTDIIPIMPSSVLDRNFLFHYLRTNEFTELATKLAVGVNLPRLSPKQLSTFEIPLCTLPEQQRIAGILDAADALRATRRDALAQLDTVLQSTFLDMFGDPVTNPMGWEVESLRNWVENIDSGWSPKCLERKAESGEWGVLKLGAVTWCEFNQDEQKALPADLEPRPELEVKQGDLLFSRKNTYELVAAAAYVHDVRHRLMLSDLIFRLRLKPGVSVEPTFLWQLLIEPHQRQTIQRLAGGAAGSMPNISKAKLGSVELIHPPLHLQRRFAAIVESVEHQKTRMRTHLAELDALFACLQSHAFTGQL